jgi:hypothetical protein
LGGECLIEEIDTLKTISPSRTAVVSLKNHLKATAGAFSPLDSGSTDSINLTNYSPNKLTYRSHASANRLAVFSEIALSRGLGNAH